MFPDTQLADPWGSYLHIDATYGMLKCAIYVHDIGPDGGPFCYVRGSQNAKIGWFEGMVRRTNDFSGFSGRRPDARKKFMALPAFLRRKADFGGDLQDNSADVARLREGHFSATSNYGNCVPVRRQRHASRRHGEQGRAPLPVHPARGDLRSRR